MPDFNRLMNLPFRVFNRVAKLFFLVAVTHSICQHVSADESPQITESQRDFFESKIRPVLVEYCYECHAAGAKIVQGGLRVDHRDGLLKGGDSGAAIIAGEPQSSLLIKALRHDGLEMPPKKRLPESVVQDFENWIAMRAPDPRQVDDAPAKRVIDIEEGRKFWAFQPISDPALPHVNGSDWPLDPIDRFVLARLEQTLLDPAPETDRYTWLRRVSFDLTGLPPSVSDIEAFVKDDSPLAQEKVVDRLLGSRGFGERWARHWLDLTGYADQVGTSNSVFAEFAWRYRDYLIDAFNSDKPFDRFLSEQIAGDLLPFSLPEERAANVVATGFLVLGDVEIVNPDKLRMEIDLVDQQVSKVGMVFMGMTLGCVRCHDHKFDPIGLEDYYGMAGIFRSTSSTHKIPNGIWSGIDIADLPETADQIAARQLRETAHLERLATLKAEQSRLTMERAEIDAELKKPDVDQAALNKRRSEVEGRLRGLPGEIEHAEFFAPTVPKAFAVHDAETIGDMHICIRGNPYAPGAVVHRGMMRVCSWDQNPLIPEKQSGRLQLAEWLTDKRHPLTARVAVNRIWQKLFGEGLVRSVDYFGTRGELPTHPELLDHVAWRFMQNGWSQKQLIRQLVLSRTYRVSASHNPVAAQRDPENRLLWRMNRQRLDAEALRDALLAVSGELQSSQGGPALPLEFQENTGSLTPMAVNPPSFSLRRYRPSQEFERTVYLPIVRDAQRGPTRLRDLFDFTQPAQMAGQRAQTVVPTQALFLLNNDQPRKRAKAIADQLLANVSAKGERVEQLWLLVLNRPITSEEREQALEFLDQVANLTSDQAVRDTSAWTELSHALLSSNEFIYRL